MHSMVPELDKAIDTMQVGDISELVETAFGFHVIERLDSKERDVGSIPSPPARGCDTLGAGHVGLHHRGSAPCVSSPCCV